MSFDIIAAHYRWMEALTFGNALQRARTFWVRKIPRPSRVLIVGEGNGRFLCELLRAHPNIEIDCVDASASMLQIARRRVERFCPHSLSHVRFLHHDILKWSPPNRYDLLVTHFFLDCFSHDELEAVIAKLADAARDNALWLLADFTVPSSSVARFYAATWITAMYLFFRLTAGITATKIVNPASFLFTHGFVRIGQTVSRTRMIKSEVYFAARGRGLIR